MFDRYCARAAAAAAAAAVRLYRKLSRRLVSRARHAPIYTPRVPRRNRSRKLRGCAIARPPCDFGSSHAGESRSMGTLYTTSVAFRFYLRARVLVFFFLFVRALGDMRVSYSVWGKVARVSDTGRYIAGSGIRRAWRAGDRARHFYWVFNFFSVGFNEPCFGRYCFRLLLD